MKTPAASEAFAPGDRPLPKETASLGPVRVAYTDTGEGEPILFVHGIPTSSYLWRNVIRALGERFRSVAPDLMGLGDTWTPLDHRYDMGAQADKLLELADHLGLDTFTLVCHDQGGAAAQWLAVHHPDRIRRFILTDCVCYDNWPVPLVKRFMATMRVRPLDDAIRRLGVGRVWAKSPIGMRLGVYDPASLSDFAIGEYMKAGEEGGDRYEQFRRFALAGDPKWTVEAASKFAELEVPTMVVWAGDDRWLGVSWGRRLFDDIAGAKRFEVIPFAGHFLQEEKPELLARYVSEFVRET
ncbi:MAG: alpha/beta fold hydrolase [Myxococcota bacterium]